MGGQFQMYLTEKGYVERELVSSNSE